MDVINSKILIEWLGKINSVLWNHILVFLLVGIGFILTIRLKGMQFRYLAYSLKLAFTRKDDQSEGNISEFQALMTALAATVGIASIAGVATAIVSGGMGAVFWMWVIALIGMATKYGEALLALKYRVKDKRGEMCGGPMYYIRRGLKWKWLAAIFALAGTFSACAGGNLIQSNSIAGALRVFHITPVWSGLILTGLTGLILIGGIKSIGRFCAVLVPVMAGFYILGGLIIIFAHMSAIPSSLALIVKSAFSGQAAIGGFAGATVTAALRFGVSRGVSSSEAGLGSGPIAAAAAKTDVPGRQALISMTTVFLSTLVVCTITALVISVTGVLGQTDVSSGALLNGPALVMKAFRSVLPFGDFIVLVGIVLFGYSTIVGWSYYGEKCIEYLLGERIVYPYRILFCCFVFSGALMSLDLVWYLADMMNGLMALPNLIGLFALSSVVVKESSGFFKMIDRERKGSSKKKEDRLSSVSG